MSTGTLFRIHLEGQIQKVVERLGQIIGILELWRAVGGNKEESAEWRFVQIWRLAFDHLDGHDT